MATFFFHGLIEQKNVITLIKKIDESDDMDIDLYFSSMGGDLTIAKVLTHYISYGIKNIKIIAHWHICSAALEVLINSVCEKELLDDAWGMVHVGNRDIDFTGILNPDTQGAFLKKEMENWCAGIINKYSSFFTKEEINRMKIGEPIYMLHDRFVLFFNTFSVVLVKEKEDG